MSLRDHLEDMLDEAFPFLDFTNSKHSDDDDRCDALFDGFEKFDELLGYYFEFASYGSPSAPNYGSDNSEVQELKRKLREAEEERDKYREALGRKIPPSQGLPRINKEGKVVYNEAGWGSELTL